MVTKDLIESLSADYLSQESLFLVDIQISKENDITVVIESMANVDISHCVDLSRLIEKGLEGESDDYSLTVTSAGLDMPFRVLRQYEKYLEREVEVVLKDGIKRVARLISAYEEGIKISYLTKVKEEGKKRATEKEVITDILFSDIKSTKPYINFK